MIEITKDNIAEQLALNSKILLCFSAPWCSPCKMMKPILEKLGTVFPIAKIDIEEHPELAVGIKSIPTFVFYRDAKIEKILVGLQSELMLRKLFE